MKRNKEMKLSIALHSAKYILTAIFIALNLLGVVHWYWVSTTDAYTTNA